jgi:hypothetical protein
MSILTEKKVIDYIEKKHNQKINDWMLNASRYSIYQNMMEAFIYCDQNITVNRELDNRYAKLILEHADHYYCQILVCNKLDTYTYLSIYGNKKMLEALDNHCLTLFEGKKKGLKKPLSEI